MLSKLKRFKFKAQVPELQKFKGKKLIVGDKEITIDTVVGSIAKPTFYIVNGEHTIGVLRFHAQMCGDKSITEEQFLEFENMDMTAEIIKNEQNSNEVKSH